MGTVKKAKNLYMLGPQRRALQRVFENTSTRMAKETGSNFLKNGPLRTLLHAEKLRLSSSPNNPLKPDGSWLIHSIMESAKNNAELRLSKSKKLKSVNLKIYGSFRSFRSNHASMQAGKERHTGQKGTLPFLVSPTRLKSTKAGGVARPIRRHNARQNVNSQRGALNLELGLLRLDDDVKKLVSVRKRSNDSTEEKPSSAQSTSQGLPKPRWSEYDAQQSHIHKRELEIDVISNKARSYRPMENILRKVQKMRQSAKDDTRVENWNPSQLVDFIERGQMQAKQMTSETPKPMVKVTSSVPPHLMPVNTNIKKMIALRQKHTQVDKPAVEWTQRIAQIKREEREIRFKVAAKHRQLENRLVRPQHSANSLVDDDNMLGLAQAYMGKADQRYKDIPRLPSKHSAIGKNFSTSKVAEKTVNPGLKRMTSQIPMGERVRAATNAMSSGNKRDGSPSRGYRAKPNLVVPTATRIVVSSTMSRYNRLGHLHRKKY